MQNDGRWRVTSGQGRARWVSVVVIATMQLLGAQASVGAEDVDAIVARGIELRRQARDAEALTEFKKAWAIEKAPRVEAQMALAEQAMGLWVEAEAHLQEALTRRNDSWIEKNRAKLTGALTVIQSHLGTLEVWGSPVGASIFVNESPIGTLPLKSPLRVSHDSVAVRARASGYVEWSQTVRVLPGEAVRQHVEMVPLAPLGATGAPPQQATLANPAPVAGEEGDSSPAAVESPTRGGKSPPQQEANDQTSGSILRPIAWAAGAGALLGLGFGVVESLSAIDKRSQFNGMPECGTSNPTTRCRILADDYDHGIRLARIGYAVGGGLAIVSTVLFLISSGDNHGKSEDVARLCIPNPGTRGLSCALTF